ncbi:30S ribosomal protein S9 [bacterium]|nr:30S ribosomal protein S9 [FCB group bacterium]MBL7190854.1 30S ribosomal protein S9 [bacterium]
MTETRYYATGRRKRSIARVWLWPGSGNITVNGKSMLEYFGREILKMDVEQPLQVVNGINSYDVHATVKGGGLSGQAGAMRLGIARALKEMDPALKPLLKEKGLLTRDPREKEREKYGLAKRRKRFQYSKR